MPQQDPTGSREKVETEEGEEGPVATTLPSCLTILNKKTIINKNNNHWKIRC